MVFDIIIIGLALWVYVSWCHVAYVTWKRHGAITPLLFVIWGGLQAVTGIAILSIFSPADLADWARRSGPDQAKRLDQIAAMTSLHLFRYGISYTHLIGFALLARVAWLELNGKTGQVMLKRRCAAGILAVLLLITSVRGGENSRLEFSPPAPEKNSPKKPDIKPLATPPAPS